MIGVCLLAVVGWQGVTTAGGNGAIDAAEHVAYARYLDRYRSIPSEAVNYEFATPPLFHLLSIAAESGVDAAPSVAAELPSNLATRGLWLALVVIGAFALTSSRRRRRVAGLAALFGAALWGIDEALSLGKSAPWSPGQLIALASGLGLIVVTGLIAREVWPEHPGRTIACAAFVAAYPVVFRMGILFHPEVPFALLCALAILVFLRAAARSWPSRLGWWLGAACGAAALTRQPAVLLIACLGGAGLWLGGTRARGFLVRAAAVTILLAGPWWGYAFHLWHNPLQSNLAPRASLMLADEPPSFYVSLPLRTLILHPYRPDSTNELLPKLHEDLWSDWYGAIHNWSSPSLLSRVTASTQSALGLVADALALGGLALLAVPAAVRLLRPRDRPPARADVGLGVLALIAVTALAGFVIMLVRFPQRDGDPIKTSYLLFTTPCWAVFSVASWVELRRRRRRLHALLVAAAVLYVGSYGADLGASLSLPAQARNLGGSFRYVDLVTSLRQNSPNPFAGGDIDFLVGVADKGSQTATGLTLAIRLPPEMRLLGAPYHERGSGCVGTSTIVCNLDFLEPGDSTPIRFSVQVTAAGPLAITATATSDQYDAHPADNTATYTVDLAQAAG